MMLLNPRLTAIAPRLGLVTSVTPAAGFQVEVTAVARTLASGPTQAFGVAKTLLNQAAGVDRLDYHLDQELQNLARSADSPEFHEGIKAFFERRSPVFDTRPQARALSPKP
jgi:enoyl-CoA hydratase/carnithine racemase